MKLNMKINELSLVKDKENWFLKFCLIVVVFGEIVIKDGLMKIEMKIEINISEEDVEVDLDIGLNDCLYN